jgi:hypothetical protein
MQMPIACNRKLKNGIFGVAVRSLPRRGELVRILGEELRAKTALGELGAPLSLLHLYQSTIPSNSFTALKRDG